MIALSKKKTRNRITITVAASRKFVKRGKEDPKEIDKSVKNRWNWSWCDKILLEGTNDHHLVGDCFRKMVNVGIPWCLWCDDLVCYGRAGLNALTKTKECGTKINDTLPYVRSEDQEGHTG